MSDTNEDKELFSVVSHTASFAERYAYSNSMSAREALAAQWSTFREAADTKSRAFANLRPLLGRMYIQLDNLVMYGRQECLPPGTHGGVLLSDKNICHKPYRELRAVADEILKMIVERNIA